MWEHSGEGRKEGGRGQMDQLRSSPSSAPHSSTQQFCSPLVLGSTKAEHSTFKDIPDWVNTEASWCQPGAKRSGGGESLEAAGGQ